MATVPTLTACTGTNADLLPLIFGLYVPEGSTVADVTYGKGVFWKRIDKRKYKLYATDRRTLAKRTDFRRLPYKSARFDTLILDPPYMHDGKSIKPSINKCYRNANTGHESVIRLYAGGLLEAARVLKKKGIVIVKCQDETESGKQHFSHVEIIQLLELFGFAVVDLFVLVQTSRPLMRKTRQKSARKNHSYAVVARFRR